MITLLSDKCALYILIISECYKERGGHYKKLEKFIRKIVRVSVISLVSTTYLKDLYWTLYTAKFKWIEFNGNYLFKLDI